MSASNALSTEAAANALRDMAGQNQRLKKADFDLSAAASGQRSKIATVQASAPLAFREADIRLVLAIRETFTTDGTADNTETFNLSHDAIDTSNTESFVLYEGGSRVKADSVDYGADSFDYTDDGTGNDLHAYYVARDPCQLEIEKSAPRASGNVAELVFDDPTSMLHERDQNQSPPSMSFSGSPLQPVVPKNWTVDIYVDGPVPFNWSDDSGDGTTAVNAVVSLPIHRFDQSVQGLGQAVKQDVIRNG